MAEKGTMSLSLAIAGDACKDFFPYELVLDEGFSQVYKAQLTVLTKTRRVQKDLRELLDQNVSLVISQRIASGTVVRSRNLHGVITGIVNLGVVTGGNNEFCYRYCITIESELARLRWTRFSRPYYGKTPADIIEEILSKYDICGQFADEYVNRSTFSKNLMFEQSNESDLAFIERIMGLYGLSWMFVHNNPAAESNTGRADLYFSEGERFPLPFYEYSDKRQIPEIVQFDFVDYDEAHNLWKMDAWSMENAIGVDGLEITASYPGSNYGSQEWKHGDVKAGRRYCSYDSLFHGFDHRTEKTEVDADIKRIISARSVSFALKQEKWTGKAGNLALAPGLQFKLRHFNGVGDSAAQDAVVTGARVYARSLWPRELSAPPQDIETGERANVEFTALDWGEDSIKRYC
ncbi:MAG: phage late control D family protein [Spirochaetaceae bacterium]|jgi:hypothetical protein|nr:phage late control D family protein [Spirochaetaceae bacterium]